MVAIAKSKGLRFSPYKMRLLADAVRSKSAGEALSFLTTYGIKRSVPLFKAIASACANLEFAARLKGVSYAFGQVKLGMVKVDQGPIVRSMKPGARGRGCPQRKRLCHIEVIVEIKDDLVRSVN